MCRKCQKILRPHIARIGAATLVRTDRLAPPLIGCSELRIVNRWLLMATDGGYMLVRSCCFSA
jgi:hypothetical protein